MLVTAVPFFGRERQVRLLLLFDRGPHRRNMLRPIPFFGRFCPFFPSWAASIAPKRSRVQHRLTTQLTTPTTGVLRFAFASCSLFLLPCTCTRSNYNRKADCTSTSLTHAHNVSGHTPRPRILLIKRTAAAVFIVNNTSKIREQRTTNKRRRHHAQHN